MLSCIFLHKTASNSERALELSPLKFAAPQQVFLGSNVQPHVVENLGLLVQSNDLCSQMLDLDFLLGKTPHQVPVQYHELLL